MNINPLIGEIYDRRAANYKDIRHLVTIKAMEKRLREVNRLITEIPIREREFLQIGVTKNSILSRVLFIGSDVSIVIDPLL